MTLEFFARHETQTARQCLYLAHFRRYFLTSYPRASVRSCICFSLLEHEMAEDHADAMFLCCNGICESYASQQHATITNVTLSCNLFEQSLVTPVPSVARRSRKVRVIPRKLDVACYRLYQHLRYNVTLAPSSLLPRSSSHSFAMSPFTIMRYAQRSVSCAPPQAR